MTETLKFIKEHGMAGALGQKREVKSVNIYDCRRIILQAQGISKSEKNIGKVVSTAINPIFIMSTMFNTKEIKLVNKTFGDMDDCFIKSITNRLYRADNIQRRLQSDDVHSRKRCTGIYKIRENGRNFFTVPAVFVIHILLSSELFR